jgi:DNA modification methylase
MSCCFYKGDCIQIMKTLPDSSFQLILIDPPFDGATKNWWDKKIDWKTFFTEAFRLLKDTGMLVIHCSIPFNYTLIREAPKPPLYSWYWNKQYNTCPLIANQQPLRCVEEILVWKKKTTTYYRQQIGDEERVSKWTTPSSYYGAVKSAGKKTIMKGKTRNHYLDYKRVVDEFSTRPEELIELLIKSYTTEGDRILDPTCFKGISGKIAKKLSRSWVGIDLHFFPERILENASSSNI